MRQSPFRPRIALVCRARVVSDSSKLADTRYLAGRYALDGTTPGLGWHIFNDNDIRLELIEPNEEE